MLVIVNEEEVYPVYKLEPGHNSSKYETVLDISVELYEAYVKNYGEYDRIQNEIKKALESYHTS